MLVKYAFDLMCRGCVDIPDTGIWFLVSVAAALALQFAGINLMVMLFRAFPRLRSLLRRR